MTEKSCPTSEKLTLYCSDDLAADDLQQLAHHLADCPDCRQAVAALKETLAALPRINVALTEAEKTAFTARVIAATPQPKRFINIQVFGAAATTIAVGLLAVVIFNPTNMSLEKSNPAGAALSDLSIVEEFEMLENLELLEELELLELLDDKG